MLHMVQSLFDSCATLYSDVKYQFPHQVHFLIVFYDNKSHTDITDIFVNNKNITIFPE